ncbi:MAG TPA: NAD-dependent epimerase/dehydratase family protein [Hyphomonadaceae bacterium]|jgi:UDP-glucuronate 4-epimerase|nr:NAD-dependent epimerase/dehydratase family protein [Hyphomonadaceae bacterium]
MTDAPAKRVLLTGAAGFVGSQTAHALLDRGCAVEGVDSLTPYYPVELKRARLAKLNGRPGFRFHNLDVASHESLRDLGTTFQPDVVIHLAAQAGVRYSIDNPFAYAHANLTGHLSVLEVVRHLDRKPLLVYASSSSVYGANTKVPFSEDDRVDTPVSLYAATKRSGELLSESYSRLYGMRQIGLRFFTVYGPWGRPDMAYWSFTRDIIEGKPIRVFNNGKLERDFTYIDDIVSGVVSVALNPAPAGQPLHRVYNIGNNQPAKLMDFIHIIEQTTGKQAQLQMEPMQPGDVLATYANIDALARDYGFKPTTSLEEGIPRFVEWYREYTAGN